MGRMRTHHRRLLNLIILGAFALRLTHLGRQSLWYDEGVTWLLSQMSSLAELLRWTAADIQPPLYYLLIWHTDIMFGHSEWALRFPSAVFGLLAIPVLYKLARRLFSGAARRGPATLLAAALMAASPLMVYYGQEARMYTLLVFEAVLSSYLLLKILDQADPPLWRAPLWYALTAAAALYTHYFALFLLLVHALIIVPALRRKRLLGPTLIMFGGAALLFAPWLPTLLVRLGDDPSYWPGALKLNEAVRKLAISFTAGDTVLEETGLWLAWGFAAAAGLGGVWVAANRRVKLCLMPRPVTWLALWLWLLLPPALILALSAQSPKFNPRYAMLAWPALALLLAGLLANMPAPTSPRLRRAASLGLTALLGLFIAATFAYSLTNWFTDPRFSKANFKALAQFVRERAAPDETVLLSSGHMFPVWAYYYGWDNWTPLPWMQRLDVSRVTTLSIAAEIAPAVQGQRGVWLVTWQDEVIDPNGVVPFWLDRIGRRPGDAGDFWGVSLEHWTLDPAHLPRLEADPIQHPAAHNFANQVDLLGLTQLSDTDLALFWRARSPLPDNLILTLDLTDNNGFDWDKESLVGPPGSANYPPSRWPTGEIVMTRHHLPWQTGSPPGLYAVEAALGQVDPATGAYTGWDDVDAQGRPQRRTALLQPVNLSQLARPSGGPLPFDPDPLVNFFPIVAVRRAILPQTAAEPGDRLLLALLWQAGEFNLDDPAVAFDLVDARGHTFRVGQAATPSRRFNLPRWQPGDMVLGQYWLNIPAQATPGAANLVLRLINAGAYPYDEQFPLASLEILPTQRNFTPPAVVDMPLSANFSGQASLLGADCPANCQAAPGQTLTLTLHWRADAPLNHNYTVFTHLLNSAETVLVNADHAPPKPTQGWVPGEIIADNVPLPLPATLPSGTYTLEVGLYNAADPALSRLPLTNGNTRLILPRPVIVQ